jgi:hypothetical protein
MSMPVLMPHRSSLDSLVAQSYAILDGIAGIGKQVQEQTESALEEMRSSMG